MHPTAQAKTDCAFYRPFKTPACHALKELVCLKGRCPFCKTTSQLKKESNVCLSRLYSKGRTDLIARYRSDKSFGFDP